MITNEKLPDMQKTTTGFKQLKIGKVGVRGIKVPLKIAMKDGTKQEVVSTVSSYCNLVSDVKGINMSRITRTITDKLDNSEDGIHDMTEFAQLLKDAHGTDDIYIKAKFQYFMKGQSPMSSRASYEPVDIIFESTLLGDEQHNYLTVEHTGMSLCPCSKEMSMLRNNLTDEEAEAIANSLSPELQWKLNNAGFGAHNQNSIITIKVELVPGSEKLWIEDIVRIVNLSVSSPVFNTLKREDEKYVTEVSYMGGYFDDNKEFVALGHGGAKFVEDIVRDCGWALEEELDKRISDYVVVVNNAESIHPEDIYATAILSAGRKLK